MQIFPHSDKDVGVQYRHSLYAVYVGHQFPKVTIPVTKTKTLFLS